MISFLIKIGIIFIVLIVILIIITNSEYKNDFDLDENIHIKTNHEKLLEYKIKKDKKEINDWINENLNDLDNI